MDKYAGLASTSVEQMAQAAHHLRLDKSHAAAFFQGVTWAESAASPARSLTDEQIMAVYDPRDGIMQSHQEMALRFARRVLALAAFPPRSIDE